MNLDLALWLLGVGALAAPAILFALMGISMLVGFPLRERVTARCTQASVLGGLLFSAGVLVLMLVSGKRNVSVNLGDFVVIPEEHFHFHLQFLFDRLSVPFAILTFVLVGTIGAFASRYLHRETGFRRFFLLYAMFLLGMIVATLAGSIETLFFGWELVGLSSALLVAFFHERSAPVVNGQRIWSIYRMADASFLIAAVALHHLTGTGDFGRLLGAGSWPSGEAALSANEALFIGLLLLFAAAGKSALIPFSGWLPRAMEGPTPSSAVFYGALSVHLGTFLLLRISPLLDLSILLSSAVVILGVASAALAAIATRVQTDVKSALAYASLTQVGIITAEIGLGFRYLPLVHIIGHACLRTLQLVRAPSLLQDYHRLENAIGSRLPSQPGWAPRWFSEKLQLRIYRLAIERGYLDSIINEYVVRPFTFVFRRLDALERKWIGLIDATPTQSATLTPTIAESEEAPQ